MTCLALKRFNVVGKFADDVDTENKKWVKFSRSRVYLQRKLGHWGKDSFSEKNQIKNHRVAQTDCSSPMVKSFVWRMCPCTFTESRI